MTGKVPLNKILVQKETTVNVDTTATEILSAGTRLDDQLLTVFIEDDGGSNAYNVFNDFTPDGGTTWFEEYEARQATVTADAEVVQQIWGGFECRMTATKATSAEDLEITIFSERLPSEFSKSELQDATTVECGLTETDLYESDDGTLGLDRVMVYLDDNGNSNNYSLNVYLSPDGTTWFLERAISAPYSATDRRIVVPIENSGHYVKVTGTKVTSAEDIDVTVEGRYKKFGIRYGRV